MSQDALSKPTAIYDIDEAGRLNWYPHKFQVQAYHSRARFTFLMKGWRGGYSSWIPKLLEKEMQRCGPGHKNLAYFAIAPTLKVATKPGSMQPSLETYFCTYMNYATYNKNENKFLTTPEGERALWGHEQKERTPIVVCHASDPDSFASATFLGGVADEPGQMLFKRDAWNTLRARMATTCGTIAPNNPPEMKGVKMGRVFAGSTVYAMNWFVDFYEQWKQFMLQKKAELDEMCASEHDPAVVKALRADFNRRAYYGETHPEMTFIRFDSTANPTFSKDEMMALKASCDEWYFDMKYRAIPRKPAGVIIEAFDATKHHVAPFKIPASWPRDVAIDFGKRNFYATFWAHDVERDRHFCYLSYHRSDLDNFGHAEEIVAQCKADGIELSSAVAGQISEQGDRDELAVGGVPATPPQFKDLARGIRLMSVAVRLDKVFIFRSKPYTGQGVLRQGFEIGGEGLVEEIKTYARPVDDNGTPIDGDPENKESFHWIDTFRYRSSWKFSALMRGLKSGVYAGNSKEAAPKAREENTLAATPQSSTRSVPDSGVYAGGGATRDQVGRYAKYGDARMLEPYLDM